jgi:hypothetical protein
VEPRASAASGSRENAARSSRLRAASTSPSDISFQLRATRSPVCRRSSCGSTERIASRPVGAAVVALPTDVSSICAPRCWSLLALILPGGVSQTMSCAEAKPSINTLIIMQAAMYHMR